MMKAYCWLLLTLPMLLGSVVHAEGECPPGMFPTNPAGTQGPVGCAPIPGYNSNQQQTQPGPPQAEWIRQWGAIATDHDKAIVSSVTGLSSKSQADHAAVADCQARGGANCVFEIDYYNECAAMVVGDHGHSVSADITLERAIQRGIKDCSENKYGNCSVYYTACSPPKKIR